MALNEDFHSFFEAIEPKNIGNIKISVAEIVKKLNKEYYDKEQEPQEHGYLVGSIGRGTSTHNCSDVDLLFELPTSLYDQFNQYETNGQSALLQEVKKKLLDRFPKSDISGDGQVVVVNFEQYTIELVPVFRQKDNTFKFPDSNNGGSWKITNPFPEIYACSSYENKYKGIYFNLCRLLRSWRETIDFNFGGLLIDTLVAKFLDEGEARSEIDYFLLLKELLSYLGSQDSNQSYWYSIGSNQKIYNTSSGEFVAKANNALRKIEETQHSPEQFKLTLRELLGRQFPCQEEFIQEQKIAEEQGTFSDTEEFIEDLFPIDIKYNLSIDAKIRTPSSRAQTALSFYLKKMIPLEYGRELIFFIKETTCPFPYEVYWKVRNVGLEAIRRNCIRGQLVPGEKKHLERTEFSGPHFVECYLVRDNIYVARDRIEVPIKIKPKSRVPWKK